MVNLSVDIRIRSTSWKLVKDVLTRPIFFELNIFKIFAGKIC